MKTIRGVAGIHRGKGRMKMPTWKQAFWVLGGGVAGFAWYYFVGCATGTCPISSNPYIMTAYGALVGVVVSAGSPRKKEKQDTSTPPTEAS